MYRAVFGKTCGLLCGTVIRRSETIYIKERAVRSVDTIVNGNTVNYE